MTSHLLFAFSLSNKKFSDLKVGVIATRMTIEPIRQDICGNKRHHLEEKVFCSIFLPYALLSAFCYELDQVK